MDLLAPVPLFSLYNKEWPMYSLQLPLPPAKMCYGSDGNQARVANSLLGAGAIVSGATIERTIVGPDVFIDTGAEVTDSILFPGVRIEAGARLHRCIIDKNVIIPRGLQIGIESDFDREHFSISDHGVVVVAKEQVFKPHRF